MSFAGELLDKRLTPIHQWSRYPFNYSGSVDLHLSINPVASAYPLDFRTASEVKSAATKGDDPSLKRPSGENLHEMMSKAMRVSGETKKIAGYIQDIQAR